MQLLPFNHTLRQPVALAVTHVVPSVDTGLAQRLHPACWAGATRTGRRDTHSLQHHFHVTVGQTVLTLELEQIQELHCIHPGARHADPDPE